MPQRLIRRVGVKRPPPEKKVTTTKPVFSRSLVGADFGAVEERVLAQIAQIAGFNEVSEDLSARIDRELFRTMSNTSPNAPVPASSAGQELLGRLAVDPRQIHTALLHVPISRVELTPRTIIDPDRSK